MEAIKKLLWWLKWGAVVGAKFLPLPPMVKIAIPLLVEAIEKLIEQLPDEAQKTQARAELGEAILQPTAKAKVQELKKLETRVRGTVGFATGLAKE